jgi:hypothetical protein
VFSQDSQVIRGHMNWGRLTWKKHTVHTAGLYIPQGLSGLSSSSVCYLTCLKHVSREDCWLGNSGAKGLQRINGRGWPYSNHHTLP